MFHSRFQGIERVFLQTEEVQAIANHRAAAIVVDWNTMVSSSFELLWQRRQISAERLESTIFKVQKPLIEMDHERRHDNRRAKEMYDGMERGFDDRRGRGFNDVDASLDVSRRAVICAFPRR